MTHPSVDLLVIGAGPAGLSAARVAAANGLHVAVLDEFPVPGGRMLGQFHEEPGQGWWIGRHVAEQLLAECEEAGVHIACGTSVHDLAKGDEVWTVRTNRGAYRAARVLLATGAAELPAPVPGWTLPGVMSIGAAQVMTNVHFVKPGQRGLIIGVNVLALAIARELTVSGVSLAGIVLPPPNDVTGETAEPTHALATLARVAHLAPSAWMRLGGKMANSPAVATLASRFFPRSGMDLWGVPLQLRTAAVSINGRESVESVTLAELDGHGRIKEHTQRDEPVDFVAIAGGLYPLAELAAVAGCPFTFEPALGGHVPVHSPVMRTPVQGLYVAGNITGVESAQVAMAQGRLAGTTISIDAGCYVSERLQAALKDVARVRSAAVLQFHPDIAAARQRLYQSYPAEFEEPAKI